MSNEFDIKEMLVQLKEMLDEHPSHSKEKKKILAYFTSQPSLKEGIQFSFTEVLMYTVLFLGVGTVAYATSTENNIIWGLIFGFSVPALIWFISFFGILVPRVKKQERWSKEERLKDLDELLNCNLITEEEYKSIHEKLVM